MITGVLETFDTARMTLWPLTGEDVELLVQSIRLSCSSRCNSGSVRDGGDEQAAVPTTARFTERLRLVPIGRDDARDLWLIHNEDEVAAWYGATKPSLEDVERQVRTIDWCWRVLGAHKWLAYDRATGELIGRGGVSRTPVDDDWGQIYAFLPDAPWARQALAVGGGVDCPALPAHGGFNRSVMARSSSDLPLQPHRQRAALSALERARRRRRIEALSAFDVFYNAYITGLLGLLAVVVLTNWLPDDRIPASRAAAFATSAGPALGIAAVAMVAFGVRVGTQGGPLSLEQPYVQHVLLAPVDRGIALRSPVFHRLRAAVGSGALLGFLGGAFATQAMPGSVLAWVASASVTGALVGVAAVAAALLTATATRRSVVAWAGVTLLGVAGVADLATGHGLSPSTWLGQLALLPVESGTRAVVPVVVIVAAGFVSVLVVGRLPLESAARRAHLAAVLRFSATMRDIRAVVVIQRELVQERPRARAWVTLPLGGRPKFPVWRRDWRGILRWPAARVARQLVVAIGAGVALVGFWRGVTVLLGVAGLLLWLIGLEAVEPLAQDTDRPHLLEALPRQRGRHLVRHLPAMFVVALLPVATALLVLAVATGGGFLVDVLIATTFSGAVAGVSGAVATMLLRIPDLSDPVAVAAPEVVGARVLSHLTAPPAIATLGLAPLLVARASPGASRTSAIVLALVLAAGIGVCTAVWMAFAEPFGRWVVERSPLRVVFR